MDQTEKRERLRLFYAVELPEAVRQLAAEHIAHLRRVAPHGGVRFGRPENLHITLKFLGEIEAHLQETASRAAERATDGLEPFELRMEAAEAFPPRGPARVLWLGITDASGRLALLQERLEEECERENFPREKRPFHPHITIARLGRTSVTEARRLTRAHTEAEVRSDPFTATEIILMKSELGPGGSRYSPLSRHRLSGV